MKSFDILSRALLVLVGLQIVGSADAVASETLIVALGSSSTAGKGVGPGGTYPAQLEAMLGARRHKVRVINAGINGDTSSGMLARLNSDVPAGTRLVILQTGTNDAGGSGHVRNVMAIVDRLEARSIKVLPLKTGLMRDLRDEYAQPDGHHLTAEGYRVLARRLLPMVERAIAE